MTTSPLSPQSGSTDEAIEQWRRVWATDPEVAIAMGHGKPALFRAEDALWWQRALQTLAPDQLQRVLERLGDPAQYPWATPQVRLTLLLKFRDAETIVLRQLAPWFATIPRDELVALGLPFYRRWLEAERADPVAAKTPRAHDAGYDLVLAMLRNPQAALDASAPAPDRGAPAEAPPKGPGARRGSR